jgi:aminomuconate-semialdehyde/2-hydroxymuconate-6-semialdehyde dehydrogenase
MTTHPDVKAISFTGSTMTGGIIAQNAAKHFKKISLEMGGKNPNIIFADCDYDEMLKTTLNSSFSNQGEICLCGSRILVEQSIYDRFISDFVGKTKKMKVGPPTDGDTRVGAIVSELHYNKILSYIALAKEEGGTIEVGGQAPKMPEPYHNGFFIEPTIITGLTHECRTNQEEIFGPVVTVQSFSSEEEALALANDSKYGLSATVWTENIHRAHRFSRKLESGIVWVNTWLKRDLRTPFGGIKQSGVGREGGMDALYFFTEVKNICIQIR